MAVLEMSLAQRRELEARERRRAITRLNVFLQIGEQRELRPEERREAMDCLQLINALRKHLPKR